MMQRGGGPRCTASLVPPGLVTVEPPLHAARVARHREAAGEEHQHREDIALPRESQPCRILEGLANRAEDIEESDDADQGRVLEEIDDVVDDTGHDMAQRLRQHDEGLNLPPLETDRVGRLLLSKLHAL